MHSREVIIIFNGKKKWMHFLEDNGLKELIDNDILMPATADTTLLDAWKKKVAKARRMLLEGF